MKTLCRKTDEKKKGAVLEVTVYVDGGMFETSYVRPAGGAIDPDRHYNTLNVKDGASLLATIQAGVNVPDQTPKIKYNIANHLGSSNVVVDTTGILVNREEYYPFGETSFGSFKYKRYRYNGKEKDEESGLYEYGQRYYAPWLCRFVSVDPVAEDYPHLSSYNYASNRPITSVDAEGLQTPDEPKAVTDASGRKALIDSKAEFVEGDTAIISQEGDKFVNVTGVGLVKESHLKEQNIIPKRADSQAENQDIQDDSSNWFQRLFGWIPDFEGSGDKSGVVSSGSTHVSEDATEINNSGIEGREVENHIEIDVMQYILRGAPGKLSVKGDNWIDFLSSGTDLFNEIQSEGEPEYDFPLPKEKTLSATLTEGDTGLDMKQVKDSINISYYKKTKSSYRVGKFIYSVEGEKIDTVSGTRQDTVGGVYNGQSIIKVWRDVHK